MFIKYVYLEDNETLDLTNYKETNSYTVETVWYKRKDFNPFLKALKLSISSM